MKPETRKEIISWIMVIVGAFIFSVLFDNFVIVNALVPTGSMMDTIPEKSRNIGFRLSYLFSEPERFDVAVFVFPDSPPDDEKLYVKRIIGLPGEKVEIIDGKVYIDDSYVPLDDSFVRVVDYPDSMSWGPYMVPEGCYFMLGDNRTNSEDSRYWTNKFVARDKIRGKIIFRYWPSFEWY